MSAQVIEVLAPSAVQVIEVNPGVPGPAGPAGTGVAEVNVTANVIAKGGSELGELVDSLITDDGTNVRIAATSASAKLQVGENVGGEDRNGLLAYTSTNPGYYVMGAQSAFSDGAHGDLFRAWNFSGSAMVITGERRVGILTSTPAAALSVGDVSQFQVGSNGTPSAPLYVVRGGTSGTATIRAPENAGNTILILPIDQGSAGQMLGVSDGAGTLVWLSALAMSGAITSSGGGIGYSTGAGGTVSQATNKSTTVVLNELCGTITMDAAALSNATTVAFTLTNSFIAATDFVMVQHSSGGTLGAYNFAVTPGAGSAVISVRNVHTASLSEAVVIRFAVFKAVVA